MQLKEYLKLKDLRIYQLAKFCNIAPSTLYKVVKGKQNPGKNLCEKIELYTGGVVTKEEVMWPHG